MICTPFIIDQSWLKDRPMMKLIATLVAIAAVVLDLADPPASATVFSYS